MNRSKQLTDGALLSAIYIVLLIISIFTPFIFIIFLFLLPIPFIFYAVKHGIKASLLMIVVTLLISLMIIPIVSIPLTVLAAAGGTMIGIAINQKRNVYEVWARGTIGFILGIIFIFVFTQFILQVNITNEIDLAIDESMETTEYILTQFTVGTDISEQLDVMREQINMVKYLIPASIAILSIFLAFVSQWLSFKLLNRIERTHLFFPPFKNLNVPFIVIWIYLVAMLLSLVDISPESTLYLVVVNTYVLTAFLIIIQGFSFIFFYADYKKLHKSIPIAIVVLSLIIPNIFLVLIRIIGIIDIGFSLKKRILHSSNKK